MKVRTRFAVSPTGYMHVGGVRNALFDWLVARQADGQFVLRIEDTDQAREVAGAVEHIQLTLQALGLDWDEGPYKQSERLTIYKEWGQKLLEQGRAYADPYTPQEVQAFRDQAQTAKQPFLYRNYRPSPRLLTTSRPEDWYGKSPLRFKSEPKSYQWHDEVMGELSTGPEVIDDFVLIKSDGFPTYNFCHIIDDHLMDITHVIRGQEFLASVPNYLNLYEALGIEPPIMATLPWIMAPGGKRKLSKRDGAKDVLDYIREGYLPEALRSFIATLGWNDGSKQEIFRTDELVQKFSLERVQKSGAMFDDRRLSWVNGSIIRQKTVDELYRLANGEGRRKKKERRSFWPEEADSYPEEYKKRVLELVQERLKYLAELPELTLFFFKDLPINPKLISEHKQLKNIDAEQLKKWLEMTEISLQESDFTVDDLQKRLNGLLDMTGQKPVVLFSLIRIATTQAPASPGLAETLAVLGKDTTMQRLQKQITKLS